MTKKTAATSNQNGRRDEQSLEPKLDSRYGQIGISAVVAALQYQGGVKNPAPAPVVYDLDERLIEVA